MLTATLPYCKRNLVRLALLEPDVHVDVTDILRQLSAGTRYGDETGLDVDSNPLRNVEFFGLEDVPHLPQMKMVSASSL